MLEPSCDIFFAPFRLDLTGRLWRGATEVTLRPKTFAVLRYLAENAGCLATAEDLAHAVWAGSHGSESLVKGCVRELRRILGDAAAAPRYIETVGRRGYRFVAPAEVSPGPLAPPSTHEGARSAFVGRDREVEQLGGFLARALAGTRQIVLLSGEPGIGKSTLAERFLEAAEARHELRIGRGRCVEHYGPREPYLPFLEALGRLGRGRGGDRIVAALGRYAPTWLTQLAPLISAEERDQLERRAEGANRERMLREMCEAAEALAAERPLVLWLDDLQWSDPSTIDLISSLAVRGETARLLLLGTYRPADIVLGDHPLRAVRRELRARGLCQELPLGFLSVSDVERYLALRFPENDFPPTVGATLLGITDGNPLFLGALLDELATRGVVRVREGRWRLRAGVEGLSAAEPESLRQLIKQQVERLAEADQRILEVASVVGREFSARVVAAALGIDTEGVDGRLEELSARAQLLEAKGLDLSPEHAASGRYGFAHALYQKFLYSGLAPSRAARLHRRLGEAEEAVWGERSGEIAAELALHFERGGDARRATRYLVLAGEKALGRHAYGEAVDLFSRAKETLATTPSGPEHDGRELDLCLAIGPPLMVVKGSGAPEVDRVYRRAAELCGKLRPPERIFPTLCGLWRFRYTRGDLVQARELADRALRIAVKSRKNELSCVARTALGSTLFYLGSLEQARAHLEAGLADAAQPLTRRQSLLPHDPGVSSLAYLGVVLWFLGYPDQALAASRRSLALAREIDDPFSLSYALTMACMVPVARAEVQETLQLSASASVATDARFPGLAGWSVFLQGWVRGEAGDVEGGVARMREGLAILDGARALTSKTFLCTLLASVFARASRPEDGLEAIKEGLALARSTGERFLEAEMLRRAGELELLLAAERRRGGAALVAKAERRFRAALRIARRQRAKSLELRAATSLARLLGRCGKAAQAKRLLRTTHAWFTEGFESRDLREARALLDELGP